MYSIEVLSQYYNNFELMYCLLVIQIFYYLFSILDLKINFKINSSDKFISYNNFNYANLIDG